MRYDILTLADLCVDLIITDADVHPEFGQKEKMVENYSILLGGSCSIFASQAARLGLRTLLVARSGADAFGDMLVGALEGAGVDCSRIARDPKMKTGVTFILNRQGLDRAMLTYSGAMDQVYPEDVPKDLSAYRHLHIGSYFLMNDLRPHFGDIAKRIKAAGGTVSLDTNWDPTETWGRGLSELLPLVDIFLPNENELYAITGKGTVREGARALLESGVPVVAVKLGEKGAEVYTKDGVVAAAAIKTRPVDTVGAGDSFDAGFLYGYLNGMPLEYCARAGCICGSLTTLAQGGTAAQPDLTRLKRHLEGV